MSSFVYTLALLSVFSLCRAVTPLENACHQNSRSKPAFVLAHHFHHGPLSDHVLVGKTYRSVRTRSLLTCAVFCFEEDAACRSFNFCKDDKRCELNSAVYSEDKSDYKSADGCQYFDENTHGECSIVETPGEWNFKFILPPIRSSDSFRLDFAAKGKQDATLSLSELENDDNYYAILIGGWHNGQSAIRDCLNCQPDITVVPTPGIMTETEYRRFWIDYSNGTIRVGRDGETAPFMEHHDGMRRVTVNFVGITSYHNKPVSYIFYNFCDE